MQVVFLSEIVSLIVLVISSFCSVLCRRVCPGCVRDLMLLIGITTPDCMIISHLHYFYLFILLTLLIYVSLVNFLTLQV